MVPIASAVANIASNIQIIQQVKKAGTDLAQAFFSIWISEKSQLQFAFMWEGFQFTFTVLTQGYLNTPVYCHYLVRRDLDLMQVSNIIIYYHDDIMIVSETEEWARIDINAMVTQMTNKGWLINPGKIQGPVPAQTVKFLGILGQEPPRIFYKQLKINCYRYPTLGPSKKPGVGSAYLDFGECIFHIWEFC